MNSKLIFYKIKSNTRKEKNLISNAKVEAKKRRSFRISEMMSEQLKISQELYDATLEAIKLRDQGQINESTTLLLSAFDNRCDNYISTLDSTIPSDQILNFFEQGIRNDKYPMPQRKNKYTKEFIKQEFTNPSIVSFTLKSFDFISQCKDCNKRSQMIGYSCCLPTQYINSIEKGYKHSSYNCIEVQWNAFDTYIKKFFMKNLNPDIYKQKISKVGEVRSVAEDLIEDMTTKKRKIDEEDERKIAFGKNQSDIDEGLEEGNDMGDDSEGGYDGLTNNF